jgi:hypothetical protein
VRLVENEEEKLIEDGEIDFKLELYELVNEPNINFEQNSIHFSYSNIGNLLKSWVFYNDINLSNIVFYTRKSTPKDENQLSDGNSKKSDKKVKKPAPASKGKGNENTLPYVLICYVNDRFNNKFKFDNIKWRMRIFSDNIISFVKDTSKIAHEEKIKNEWELNQPGRKLKASDSRKKYLIYGKKMKGMDLSEEEKQILNQERVRSSDAEKEELLKEESDKNKKHNKKSRNKGKDSNPINNINKNLQNQTNNEITNITYTKINKLPIIHSRYLLDTNQFKMNRILKGNKKNESYHSLYISNYMNYINQKRVIHFEGLQKNISILNKEFLDKYNQKIIDDFDRSEKIIKQENYFVKSKDDADDPDDKKFSKFLTKFGSVRIKASDSMKDLMSKRHYLNKDLVDKIAIEKKIKDILEAFNNRLNTNTNEKEKSSKSYDIDINEIINVYEKAKELLSSSDTRLEELANIIDIRKEELANVPKVKNNKKK